MTKFICPGQAGPVFRHDHYLSTSHNEQWWQVQFSLYSRESGMLLMYLLLLTTICLEISGRCGRQLMTVTIGRRVLAVALAQALAHRWLLDYWLNCTPNRQQIDIWVHYTDHNYNYFLSAYLFGSTSFPFCWHIPVVRNVDSWIVKIYFSTIIANSGHLYALA